MARRFLFSTFLGLFLGLFPTLGEAREILLQRDQELPVYFLDEAPEIDGEGKEGFWEGVPAIPMHLSGKTAFETGRTETAYPAKVRLAHDGTFLYLFVDAVNPAAPGGEPGKDCWERDGMELVFSTQAGKASSACQVIFLDRFGQLQVAPRNASGISLDKARLRWKTVQRQGAWSTELAIPLADLAIGPQGIFHAFLGRGNYEQEEISASTPGVTSFHDWQATRPCRLLQAPLALALPDTFPCDSRRFAGTLAFHNYGKSPVEGELRVCRSEKAYDSLGEVLFPTGDHACQAEFSLVNHSLPFWLEVRGRDGRLLWRTAEYRYAGDSLQSIVEALPAYFQQTGHPYFQELHRRLSRPEEQVAVYRAEEKTLRRFLAPLRNGRPELLEKPFYFYTATSMAKDASSAILPETLPLPQEVSLSAAKGETVNFQVRVLPLDKPVRGLTVKEFYLYDIPQAGLNAYRILDLLLPGDGVFPDPLSRHLTVDLTPEMNSATYFFSLSIPRSQPAGTYTGSLVLADGEGHEQTCPVSLKVWDFALPDSPRMFAVISYVAKASPLYRQEFPEKNEYQLDKMFRELITSYGFMPFKGCSHPDYLDQEHMRLYDDWRDLERRFHMVHLGSLPWYYDWLKGFYEYDKNREYQTAQEYTRSRIQEFEALARQLRDQGANMDNAFAYYDELESPGHLTRIGRSPDNSESLGLLKELKERTGLKLFTCFCFPNEGDDVPAAEAVVDLFLFNSNYFPEGTKPLCDIEGLKARGKRVGWYWNVDKSPLSFNMANWPDNVGLRTHFHKMHRLGLEYTLLWGLCSSVLERVDRTGHPWVSTHPGGVDGLLAYPEDGGLVPSLRLELLRESDNDGRLITLAEELAEKAPGSPAAARIQEMLQDDRFFANPRKCSLTPREVLDFHDELGSLMEALTK